MTKEVRVIKRYKSFILGFCACNCGEEIKIRNSQGCLGRFKTHHNFKQTGMLHNNYKFGRSKFGNYYYIRFPEYYRADKYGRVYEHIYFYEVYHKCCLLPWTDIHHIEPVTNDYCNNMPWNLEAMMKGQHSSLTNSKTHVGVICFLCKSDKTYVRKRRGKEKPEWRIDEDGNYICTKCSYKKWSKER